ncbi:hypothetical protein MPTK1_4g15810 [Marchantia polymorpha subsp. ruderalis]|uniref:Uncharacterized protein n=2 Tax=Marchantia polymorpha TaxID=3197 RepID=A0AAF6BAB3_MARPO|nr:hypothetical protein MARPO_0054s0046 [Marchantia polymorpha]BBN08947.1 hypothetical protein Mp_4g15810 [Marchantia polymorpha subsp. ruderalis]|eukprot:PTQ37933.1 hypothetical protein MARPO_0054s0046 [Marchantia polymorpha]
MCTSKEQFSRRWHYVSRPFRRRTLDNDGLCSDTAQNENRYLVIPAKSLLGSLHLQVRRFSAAEGLFLSSRKTWRAPKDMSTHEA